MSLLTRNLSIEAFDAGLNVALWTPFGTLFGVVASLPESAWMVAAIHVLVMVVIAIVG